MLHVDMDAFYAAVATRDDPSLQGVPVIVGGGHRGVVLSASYEARRSGVRSGIPMTRARRLCPEAEVLRPDYALYSAVSRSVLEIFGQVTPVVQPLSLDEAFLDVQGSVRLLGGPAEIGALVRARVHDEQGITCSVGAADTIGVAKVASKRAKPDGQLVVPAADVVGFLHPLPVGELWGVGDKTVAQLERLGLRTVGDVAHTPRSTVQRALGRAFGAQVHDLAWGIDDRLVAGGGGPRASQRGFPLPAGVLGSDPGPDRSVGADETFGRDTDDPQVLLRELLRLTAKVTARMRAAEVVGRTVTVKVRFADFTTITRTRTRSEPTDVTHEVYDTVRQVFAGLGLQRARVRLVGVRVENLQPRRGVTRQLVLGERPQGWAEADRAVDRAATRFGDAAVRPASLLGPGRP
ncbi:DNA polymerase IV [Nocardioides marmoribigeumensis]